MQENGVPHGLDRTIVKCFYVNKMEPGLHCISRETVIAVQQRKLILILYGGLRVNKY